MRLRHATPAANVGSILATGLDPARSQGRRQVCWLHTPGRTEWAVGHTEGRHGTADVVVLRIRVPRSWLSRSGRRGRWMCGRVIPPSRITFPRKKS